MATMTSFAQYAARLEAHADNIEKAVEKHIKKIFLEISGKIIFHTPIDSGQATLNWTASKGKIATRFVNVQRTNVKQRQGYTGTIIRDKTTSTTANATAMVAVRAVASSWDLSQRGIYLNNSLDYIADLWKGTWPSNPRTIRQILEAKNWWADLKVTLP